MEELTAPRPRTLAGTNLQSLRLLVTQLPGSMRTLDGASMSVVWVCIVAARALPHVVQNATMTDPLVAVLTLPLLVIVPRQIGVLLLPLARVLSRGRQVQLNALEAYVVAWLAGIWLTVLGVTMLTGIAGVPSTVATAIVLTVATASACARGLRPAADHGSKPGPREEAPRGRWWPIAVSLALVSFPLALIRLSQPYPLQSGWGLFSYNYHILQFIDSDQISIAPGLHTPIHATLLGISGIATGAEIIGLLWATPLLLYGIYGLGTFLFGRRVLGDNLLALVALWVALWVLALPVFRHLHAAGMRGILLAVWPWILILLYGQFPSFQGRRRDFALRLSVPLAAVAGVALARWFLPSLLQVWALLLLAILLLGAVRSLPEHLRQSVALLTFVGASLTFIHIIEGPLFFAVGLGFVLLLSWQPTSVRSRMLLAAASALTAGFIALQATGGITFDDPSTISRIFLGADRADAILLPFEVKLDKLLDGLAPLILALLAFSTIRVLFWPDATHLAALAVIVFVIFLYFLPETGLHRALGPATPLLGLSIALELGWLAQRLLRLGCNKERVVWRGALVVAALIALTPALTSSLQTQARLPSQFGFPLPRAERELSNIAIGEYRASVWIAENTPREWAIVSDPSTMFFMEGLTLHPQVAQQRAWVAESEYSEGDRTRLLRVLPSVFGAPTVGEAIEGMELLTQEHDGSLLVVSGRTLAWLTRPETMFRLRAPAEIELDVEPLVLLCVDLGLYDSLPVSSIEELEPCPARFFVSELFSVIYNQDGVAVLAPRHQLDELVRLR